MFIPGGTISQYRSLLQKMSRRHALLYISVEIVALLSKAFPRMICESTTYVSNGLTNRVLTPAQYLWVYRYYWRTIVFPQ
jgi:hypothetical protein